MNTVCKTCGSVGFDKSLLGIHRCTFCDGTEGGNPPDIAREYVGNILHSMFYAGWVIEPTSCQCGGSYAWLKPRESGAKEMFGCVCHNTTRAMEQFLQDNDDR